MGGGKKPKSSKPNGEGNTMKWSQCRLLSSKKREKPGHRLEGGNYSKDRENVNRFTVREKKI